MFIFAPEFIYLLINLIVMVNKKFLKLLDELSNLGLSSSSDSIKTNVPRNLIFDVLSFALDLGFTLIIDKYDDVNEIYVVTFKYNCL